MRHTIRNDADIDALAASWGVPTRAELDARKNQLEAARQAVAAQLPADWQVQAAPFDIDAAGFAVKLPNGWRQAVRTRTIPTDIALITEVADKLRELGEANLAKHPPA